MGIPPKWWIAVALLWLVLSALFTIAEGSYTNPADAIRITQSVAASAPGGSNPSQSEEEDEVSVGIDTPTVGWSTLTRFVTWSYPILNNGGRAEQWFKYVMQALSLAVLIPVGYVLATYIRSLIPGLWGSSAS